MGRKKGVILSYVMMVLEVLSTLLITPFLIRTLGQAEYGVYKLSASVTAYLLLLDLGIGNAIIRYISKYRSNKDRESEQKFFGVSILFYLSIAVLALLIGGVLWYVYPSMFSKGLTAEEISLGQTLLLITIANVAVTMGTTVYAHVIVAHEKFHISKGFSIIQILIRMLMTVVVLKMGLGSIGIVSVNLALTILCRGTFVLYVFWKLKLRPMFKGIRFDFIKDILVYSVWILVQMIATQINASMDQILLGSLVTSASAIIAVYSVGTQIVQYFRSIGGSFTGVLMPGVVRLVENGASSKALCDEMVRIGRIIFIVLGLIFGGFIVFGQQFIVLWAGDVNADAYYVAVMLMFAYMLITVESIGTQVLWAKNEHKDQAIMQLAVVLVNIVFTVFLIKWNPLFGATIGTVISLIVGDIVVLNILFAKKLGIRLTMYYKGLLKGLALSLLVTVAAGYLINLLPIGGWFGLILKIVLTSAVYAGMLWLYGMNAYEKNLIGSLLKKKTKSV